MQNFFRSLRYQFNFVGLREFPIKFIALLSSVREKFIDQSRFKVQYFQIDGCESNFCGEECIKKLFNDFGKIFMRN